MSKKDIKFDEYMDKLCFSVGIVVDDDRQLYTTGGEEEIKMEELPLRLPTKENIKNQNGVVNGVIKKKYNLFNPFSEDALKRNSSLTLLMRYMSAMSSISLLQGVMRQLMFLLSNEEAKTETSTEIKMWMVELRKEIGNRGSLLDKKTAKDIDLIIQHLLSNGLYVVRYRLGKGETIAGIRYERVSRLDLEAIEIIEDDDFLETLKISEKARTIFLSMVNFILPDIKNYMSGSKSALYPSFISAYNLYIDVQGRINYLLDDMKDVLVSLDELIMPLAPSNVEIYKADIDYLPSSNKLETTSTPVNTTASSVIASAQQGMNNVGSGYVEVNNQNINQNNTYTPMNEFNQQNNIQNTGYVQNNNNQSQNDDSLSAMRREYGVSGNRSGFVNNFGMQVVDNRVNGGMNPNGMSLTDKINYINNNNNNGRIQPNGYIQNSNIGGHIQSNGYIQNNNNNGNFWG